MAKPFSADGRRALIAVLAVVVFAVAGCGGSGGKTARLTPTPHDSPSRLPPIYPGTTVSIPPSTSTSASSTSPSSSAPVARTIPGDGTFRTGVDLVPGVYRSQGGESCYWERLRGFGGQTADIIANGAGIVPQTVSIAPTDAGFRSQGCAPWTLITDAATTTTTSVALPAGAQACPSTSGPAGGFAHSAAGSPDTSCPFAEQVRLAYGAGGPSSVTPRQVEAESPVTGQHYTMTCAANGSMVVCNGGNGAVVYVY